MIAAGVSVFYKNSVLLAKRIETHKGKPVPFGGYWSIFTGAVDPEDLSVAHAAQRELKEEADIDVDINDLVFIQAVENPNCTLNVYAYESPEIIFPLLDFEHTEFGWFALESLQNFHGKLDPKVMDCIRSYKNNSNN